MLWENIDKDMDASTLGELNTNNAYSSNVWHSDLLDQLWNIYDLKPFGANVKTVVLHIIFRLDPPMVHAGGC